MVDEFPNRRISESETSWIPKSGYHIYMSWRSCSIVRSARKRQRCSSNWSRIQLCPPPSTKYPNAMKKSLRTALFPPLTNLPSAQKFQWESSSRDDSALRLSYVERTGFLLAKVGNRNKKGEKSLCRFFCRIEIAWEEYFLAKRWQGCERGKNGQRRWNAACWSIHPTAGRPAFTFLLSRF